MKTKLVLICLLTSVISLFCSAAFGQTTAFTYQGRLSDGASTTPSGTYQMKFTLHNALFGECTQLGPEITDTNVTVANGVFTVRLDFGAEFNGAERWLEIKVKKTAEASYTTLSPRQQILSAPYAIRTLSATSADGLSNLCAGCVDDAKIDTVSGSKVTGAVASANTVTGTVAVANGGTGAANAAGARTNLGLGTLATVTPSGSASNTTFLRGDNTWASVSGGGGGAAVDLVATKNIAQSLSPGGTGVMPDDVSFNNVSTAPTIAGASFDGTTYTVGQSGHYLITVNMLSSLLSSVTPQLLVNGTTVVYGVGLGNGNLQSGTPGRGMLSTMIYLTAGQMVKIKAANTSTATAAPLSTDGSTRISIVKL